jgi:predicted nucleotidyltransferase
LPYAFVGGSVVNLLLDHPQLTPARPTDDVDVIIDMISGARYSDVEARLRGVGFSHDMRQGAPKCRWILGDLTVDIMPSDGARLGLNTAWFAEALATATLQTVVHSRFRIVSPVAFLATKYTAFIDRGHHDYHGSHDLEDFMTVVDGRASIVAEIDRTTSPLRDFVITCTQKLLAAPEFRDALPGYLPPEEEGRIGLLRQKLEDIAKLALLG